MIVSRETREKLDLYLDLLRKWNSKINLVAQSTIDDAASRHIDDSLQIATLSGADVTKWTDLGSGGGFPGAVIAMVLSESMPGAEVTLIESDQRKCAFLRTVSRETKTAFSVLAKRIEDTPSQQADVISARALAPLSDLLGFAELHLSYDGKALFPKGERWQEELDHARKHWKFEWEAHKSVTNPNAVILEIGDLSRA